MASSAGNPPDVTSYREQPDTPADGQWRRMQRDDAAPTPDAVQRPIRRGEDLAPAVRPDAVTEDMHTVDRVAPMAALPAHDRVRWGPIWAGLLTAFMVFLVLEVLAYALGLLSTTNANGTQTASQANPWVTGVIALIAFFVGGWVAEATSAVRGGDAGLLNGFMVWALGTTLILAFSILGLSALFGAVGQFAASGHTVNTGNVNAGQVTQATFAAAWGAFATLVLTAIAAALGGLVGSGGTPIGRLWHGR